MSLVLPQPDLVTSGDRSPENNARVYDAYETFLLDQFAGSNLRTRTGIRDTLVINIINQATRELARVRDHGHNDHTLLALTTRNIFELRLFLRHLNTPEKIRILMAERARDEIDFVEGNRYLTMRYLQSVEADAESEADDALLKAMASVAASDAATANANMNNYTDKIRALIKKDFDAVVVAGRLNPDQKRSNEQGGTLYVNSLRTASTLAEDTDLAEEKNGLFSFLSKYIHPTPFIMLEDSKKILSHQHFVFIFNAFIMVIEGFLADVMKELD